MLSTWSIGSVDSDDSVATYYPCLSPKNLLAKLGSQFASDLFVGKANSYVCPYGKQYGQAWVLMDGLNLRQLTWGSPQNIKVTAHTTANPTEKTLEKGKDGNREVVFRRLYIQRAICVSPVKSNAEVIATWTTVENTRVMNDASVYLVELVDVRYLFQHLTAVNKGYNILCPVTSPEYEEGGYDFPPTNIEAYFEASLKEESLVYSRWEYNDVLENLWERIPESMTNGEDLNSLPSLSPTVYPLQREYFGWNVWDALYDLLDGVPSSNAPIWTPVINYDPLGFTFDYDSSAATTSADLNRQLLAQQVYDYQIIENLSLSFPERYRVFAYHNQAELGLRFDHERTSEPGRSWYMEQVLQKNVDTQAIPANDLGMLRIPDSVEPLWSPMLNWHNQGPYPTYYGDNDPVPVDTAPTMHAGESADHDIYDSGGQTSLYSYRCDYDNYHKNRFGKIIYSGLATYREGNELTYVRPGSSFGHVIWRDYGDELGLVTETYLGPKTRSKTSPLPSAADQLCRITSIVSGNSEADRRSHYSGELTKAPPKLWGIHNFPIRMAMLRFVNEYPPTTAAGTVVSAAYVYHGIIRYYCGVEDSNPQPYEQFTDYQSGPDLGDALYGDDMGPHCLIYYDRTDDIANIAGSPPPPNVWVGRCVLGFLIGTRDNLPMFYVHGFPTVMTGKSVGSNDFKFVISSIESSTYDALKGSGTADFNYPVLWGSGGGAVILNNL